MRKNFLKSVLAAALSGAMLLSCPAMGSVSFAAAEDVTEEAAETEIAEPEENQEVLSDEPEMDRTEDVAAEGVKAEETNAVTEDSLTSEEKRNEAEIQTLSAEDEIVAYASTDVAINEANFPDAAFRQYVKEHIDSNSNGKLSQEEILDCYEIDCSEKGISSLEGIKYFTCLSHLNCSTNKLTSLDISQNSELYRLECNNNKLTSLDVSKNPRLYRLECNNNELTSLDVTKNPELCSLECNENKLAVLNLSKNTKLETLYCYSNQLKSLDVTNNTQLRTLHCGKPIIYGYIVGEYDNLLSSLDLSKNLLLRELCCNSNKLSNLDVSKNSRLYSLECFNNKLVNLDVTKNPELIDLNCATNQLVSLDVTKNPELIDLDCDMNQLTSLNVNKNTNLQILNCHENNLKDLDVSKNTKLVALYCDDNQLASLDVSKNANLTHLGCSGNQLTILDVTKNTQLKTLRCGTSVNGKSNSISSLDLSKNLLLKSLDCGHNNLTNLDVTKNKALETLDCSHNALTSLDVSKNTALTELYCSGNALTSLDVSKNTVLTELWCGNNQLTNLVTKNPAMTDLDCSYNALMSLDVSKNTGLTWLLCSYNALTSLDVSKNTALTELYCYSNALTSLDVSKNTVLTKLRCENNQLTNLITKNPAMTDLSCYNNALTSLNVSKNTALEELDCYGNHLNSVDTSKNTKLSHFVLLNTSAVKIPVKVASGIQVSWEKSFGADGYYVYRRIKGGSWTRIAEVKGEDTLSYIDKTATASNTYDYTVRGYYKHNDYDETGNPIEVTELSDYDKNGKSITIGSSTLATPKITAVSNEAGGIKVTWGKVTGAAKYRVYYKTGSGSWTNLADTTATSYTWAGAKSGIKYTFTVRCISADGKSVTSDYDKNGKSITIPASTANIGKPTVNTPTKVSNGVKVTWSKVSGANSYYVYRRTKGGSWSRLAIVNGGSTVSYTDTSVKAGITYEYTVRAYDGKTLGDYDKNGKSITIPTSTTSIGKPTVNTPTKVSNGVKVSWSKVSWSKVSGANSYYVYRRVKGGSWDRLAIVNGGSTVSYTDTTVKAGTTYEYTVRAYDGKTLGDYDKNGKSITIPASTTSIGKPTVNTPTKVSNGVKVSWSKVSGANSYYVYRRTKGGSWSRLAIVNGGSTVSYTDTTVKAGTTYEYTVRAYDGKTLGDYDKNGKSITIPASTTSIAKPTVNTPTKVSNGVKVSWSKVSGANSYYVYRRTKGGSWSRLALVNGGSTVFYTDTTVKAGTTYEYTVRAYDGKTLGDYDKNGKSIAVTK